MKKFSFIVPLMFWICGCASQGGSSTVDTLNVLERGKATGEIEVIVSGAPLSLNNTISAGPTGAVHFKGKVDFSSPLERQSNKPNP